MLLWVATAVLAGHGHGGGNAFGFGDTGKHISGQPSAIAGKSHGNKHGKDSGLDRAYDVAVKQGQEGRANATTHQADKDSSSETV